MKKILLSTVLGLATSVVFGQIEAGTKILGGTLSFYSNTNKTENTAGGVTTTTESPSSSLTILPSFGYMFKENMGAGIRIGINNSSSGPDTDEHTNSMTIVGLFGRYYIEVAGDQLFFHTDLILDFGFGSEKHTTVTGGVTTETETDLGSNMFGLQPGWDYFIGDKWAIEMNWGWLGYSSSTRTTDTGGGGENKQTATSFGLDFDYTSFGLGARWYF